MVPASGISSAYPGKYVAINTKTDEVVLVADTPQEQHEDIQAKGPSDCRNHARRGDDHTSSSADHLGWRRRALAIPVGPPRRAACAAADRSCRVQRAREAGFTWAQIAAALGVSPQPPTRKHVRRLGSQGNRPT